MSDWVNHIAGVTVGAKGKTLKAQLFQMVYTDAIHTLRMERNQRLYEKKSRTMEGIAKEIAFTCNVRAQAMISTLLQSHSFWRASLLSQLELNDPHVGT